MKERPTGITVLAVIYIILGMLSLFWALFVFGWGGMLSLFNFDPGSVGNPPLWNGFVGIVVAIIQIVVAVGLFNLQRWAWILALVAVGLNIVQGILAMFGGGLFTWCCGPIMLIIPVGILIYLLTPGVRQAFE